MRSLTKQLTLGVSTGCKVTGDIKTDHNVQIHGEVVGNITAETVVVGRGGIVVGDINAPVLFLHGTLDGSATVNTANVFNAAKMTGTLAYKTLNITGNTGLDCKLSKRKDEGKGTKHE